jgi:serine/threonine protein kinase
VVRQVDWWALGIVIHEMLAGYPPWYDKDAFAIYQQVPCFTPTPSSLPRPFNPLMHVLDVHAGAQP